MSDPCNHPKLSIIRSINYNADRTANVIDRCRMCLATRTVTNVSPDVVNAVDWDLITRLMGDWKP